MAGNNYYDHSRYLYYNLNELFLQDCRRLRAYCIFQSLKYATSFRSNSYGIIILHLGIASIMYYTNLRIIFSFSFLTSVK